MVHHPTPHREPKPEASSGVVAELALYDNLVYREFEPHAGHNEEEFFQKYRELVPKHDWEAFRSLISRERKFQATLFRGLSRPYSGLSWRFTMGEWLDPCSDSILLIEDVDIRCILALDDQFDFDPQFILSYAGLKGEHDHDPLYTPNHESRKSSRGTKGSWYRIDGSAGPYASLQTVDSRSPVRRMDSMFWKRGQTSKMERPWCQEACRQRCTYGVQSVIACYCLSDSLRE